MAFNTSILTGRNGIIRIITLVLGIIIMALAGDTYIKNYAREEFFFALTIILFIISLVWILLSIFEVIAASDATKKFDLGFHLIGGLLLLIAAIVWIVSAFEIGEPAACRIWGIDCRGFYIKRVVVGFLGILNGLLYISLGYFFYKGE